MISIEFKDGLILQFSTTSSARRFLMMNKERPNPQEVTRMFDLEGEIDLTSVVWGNHIMSDGLWERE